jgi:competence protein ComEA
MKHRISKTGLITLAFIFATGVSHADMHKTEAAGKPDASSQAAKGGQAKAAAMTVVDINSASKAELKTLPGIDDALATKIIAGRPYLSKAFLLTHHVIPVRVYEKIRRQIIAKQK